MRLKSEVRSLLSRPNFAHLATVMTDGTPLSTPVWVGLEGDHILIACGEESRKVHNARRHPFVGLSLLDFHDPYEEAQIRGRVIEFRDDSDFKVMDAISRKYTGKIFPYRDPVGRLVMVIAVDKQRYAKLPFRHSPPVHNVM